MINVAKLHKVYGTLKAVDDLSFDVGAGEIVGLIGPNGAGKTSTLRCIAGIHRPSAGTVRVAGHDIVTDAVAAKRHLAFIADEPQLFDYLTVREHLELMARIYQVSDALRLSGQLLEELELTAKAGDLPAELSRGMKQKVAIACGLLHSPKVLVLDEPLTGLDPGGIRKMKDTILQRAADGVAVVVSSHLLHLVEAICSRIVIIHRGTKVADGTLAELTAQANASGTGSTLEQIFMDATGTDQAPRQ
jgi:ABC-2 type transport system ATP-binding protein